MSIDQSVIYAKRYEADPTPLKQAVLGASPQGLDIDPYTALRALQHIGQAKQMQMAQTAQQAPAAQAQPSIADAELAKAFGTGGIVAFAHGGIPRFDGEFGSEVKDNEEADARVAGQDDENLGGDPNVVNPYIERIRGIQPHVIDKDADESAIIKEMRRAQSIMGRGDPYAEFKSKLATEEAGSAGELEKGKGLAMLQAAGAILEPGGLARGLGKAGQAFGAAYGDVLKADRAAKQARDQMRFHLTDAERKEKLGLYRDAAASIAAGHANAIKGQQFEIEKIKAEGTLATAQARLAAGNKGAGTKTPEIYTENRAKELIAGGMKPEAAYAKASAESLKLSHPIERISDIGPTSANLKQGTLDADTQAKLDKAWAAQRNRPEALSAADSVAYEANWKKDWLSKLPTTKVGKNTPETPAPTKGDFSHLWTK